MRLDVAHPGTGRPRETVERHRDLVDHLGGELVGVDVDEAPPEAREVAVADLGPDGNATLGGHPAGGQDDGGVTRVEAAGDVRAGDDVEHRLVVAEDPPAVGLAEVGVEVDGQLHRATVHATVHATVDIRPRRQPRPLPH